MNNFYYVSSLITLIGAAISHNQSDELKVSKYEVTAKIAPLKDKLGSEPIVMHSKQLSGSNIGSLVGSYLGHKGKLPKKVNVDFTNNLEKMWKIKLNIDNVTPATKKNVDFIINRYASETKDTKSVHNFINTIDTVINSTEIQWEPLCKKIKVDSDKCSAYQTVVSKLKGKNLAAYGMTELMPSKSGDFNYHLLETLLLNAGENYLASIPAMGDKYLSLGFYQFTSYAVRHDSVAVEGANIVSLYSNNKIPGSVVALKGNDHHQAAYYFAAYNIGRLIRNLNHKQTKTLLSGKCSINQLTEMIAVAHHNPKHAIRNAENWIDDGCTKSLQSYLGPRLEEYAKKTERNLSALNSNLKDS